MPRFTVLETSALFSNRVKYDYLFELEMWLKGLERFFQIDCLPLSVFERSHASLRNYVEEVAAARSGVAHMGLIATQLMGEGQEDLASFLLYLDTQVQRAGTRKRGGDGTTELARVVETLDDFAKILDELAKAPFIPLQTYLSLGRIVVGTLRQDPNLGVLFRENLRPVLDRESKQSLAKVLGSLPDPSQRGALATLFVALFKGLRVAERVSSAAESPATRKRALLIFSLLKAESDSFVSYVKRRLRPRFEDGTKEAEGLDRLAAAFEAETRKAMDVELVGVALTNDPEAVLARLEDAARLFRDLFQQSVIGLAETFSSGIDARVLFPEYRARLDQSLRLREELGHLLRATQDFLKTPDKKGLRALVTEIESFRRGGMRDLMFRDWSLFERFHAGFSRERAPRAFLPAANQFDGFLRTLVKEVGKRAVLADHPFRGFRPDPGSGGASRYN
ncbi:MAG TPA: hypothetical protein VMV60_14580 [Thermoanaerobaculia bacterium]|nr:hypothetical protein [Thermoanaerobaculia bacterium]